MKGEYGTYKVVRNRKGQFKNRGFVKGIVLAVTVLVIGAIVWTGEVWVPAQNLWGKMKNQELKAVNTFIPVAEAAEVKPETLEEMKGDVLDRLAKCESGGKETTIVFDTNGKASVGNYQWQLASFRHYYEKKTGVKLTDRQAAVMALDDVKARELASWVIFDTEKGGSYDWVNCFKWHDLDTLVKFIKAHSK